MMYEWEYVEDLDQVVNSPNGIGASFDIATGGEVQIMNLKIYDSLTGKRTTLPYKDYCKVVTYCKKAIEGMAYHAGAMYEEARW